MVVSDRERMIVAIVSWGDYIETDKSPDYILNTYKELAKYIAPSMTIDRLTLSNLETDVADSLEECKDYMASKFEKANNDKMRGI